MMRLEAGYFEAVYAKSSDPWGFASRWYEARKYALTLAALPREHYRRAFEPGCSIGVLTAMLAPRCDALVATEILPDVVEEARKRVASLPQVTVRAGAIPEDWPEGSFDLILLSEVAYYLTPDGLSQLIAHVHTSLDAGAHLVAVHYTGETDYPMRGADVHGRLDAEKGLHSIAHYTEREFILSVYERNST